MTDRRRFLLRGAVSLGLLAALAWLLDPAAVAGRLAALDARWVAAALALSVLQVAASAWRWRFTLRRLGGDLPLSTAVSEYYLATFLNQLLPGGVAGDVTRAWRNARAGGGADRSGAGDGPGEDSPGPGRRAVSAVLLERASGQAAMALVALASAGVLAAPAAGAWAWLLVAAVPGGVLLVAPRVWRPFSRVPAVAAFARDARRGLLARDALPVQLVTSLGVVGSYLGVFLLGAAALGVETSPWRLAPLVAPVLLAMLLPVTVAGWGVRETAAAALWGAVGLGAADGVAISVTYGLLVLVSALPGGVILLASVSRRRDPGRRGGPSPGGSAASGGAAPPPGS